MVGSTGRNWFLERASKSKFPLSAGVRLWGQASGASVQCPCAGHQGHGSLPRVPVGLGDLYYTPGCAEASKLSGQRRGRFKALVPSSHGVNPPGSLLARQGHQGHLPIGRISPCSDGRTYCELVLPYCGRAADPPHRDC